MTKQLACTRCDLPWNGQHDGAPRTHCNDCERELTKPSAIRVDWEWDDGSCNYTTAENLGEAENTADYLLVQAHRISAGIRIWFNEQLRREWIPEWQ